MACTLQQSERSRALPNNHPVGALHLLGESQPTSDVEDEVTSEVVTDEAPVSHNIVVLTKQINCCR